MAQLPDNSIPRKGENSGLWFIKMITGPLLVILIFIHMIMNHLIAPDGLMSYNDVIQYFSNPLIVGMEILLVITVVVHSLLGVRSVILDLNPSRKLLNLLNWFFGVGGTVTLIYGIWLAITIASQSK